MKKLLTALLLTFVLAFTYSCSDTAGDSAGGPDTDPDTDPDKPIIDTGKKWTDIKFLDDIALPAPTGVTMADKVLNDSTTGSLEVIINDYTYENFKAYVKSLKADGGVYNAKTHSMVENVLGGETVLLPATLEDTKSTYFVFDNNTHYTKITFYGDKYTGERTATYNLSIKLTKTDPFSSGGGQVDIIKDSSWTNIAFMDDYAITAPTGVDTASYVFYDNASVPSSLDTSSVEIIVTTFTYANFKTYVESLKGAGAVYNAKTHSMVENVLGGETVLLPATLEDTKSTYFVFDNNTHYTKITFYGDKYTGDKTAPVKHNLSIKSTKIDPFSKIGGKVTALKDVLWADIKFKTGAELPALDATADFVFYDNATDKQEMSIDVKVLTYKAYKDYFMGVADDTKFTRHKALPLSAKTGIEGYINDDKSATWVVTDKFDRYISLAYAGTNSPAYTDSKINFKVTINSADPFAKGESVTKESLTLTQATTEIAPTITFPELDMIASLGAVGKVVAFNDTNYGKEIRFEIEDNNSNYTAFRDYLGKAKPYSAPTAGLITKEFKNKTHHKVPTLAFMFNIAYSLAVPVENTPSLTAAWAFIDEDVNGVKTYISFIWHGSKSPNNPNKNGKATFIIERMTFDPMWFLP